MILDIREHNQGKISDTFAAFSLLCECKFHSLHKNEEDVLFWNHTYSDSISDKNSSIVK